MLNTSTAMFNLKHTCIILLYQFRNYLVIWDERSKHFTLAAIIIIITPGSLVHDTNVRTREKKKKNQQRFGPLELCALLSEEGQHGCGRCKSIKQDVYLRIGLTQHTAGRDELVFTRRGVTVKLRWMLIKGCLSNFYQASKTFEISTVWTVDQR